jgi:hypothetical protein
MAIYPSVRPSSGKGEKSGATIVHPPLLASPTLRKAVGEEKLGSTCCIATTLFEKRGLMSA